MPVKPEQVERIAVELGERRYVIDIALNAVSVVPMADLVTGPQALLVSDSHVAPLHLQYVLSRLLAQGNMQSAKRIETLVIPSGESNKSFAQAEVIFAKLAQMQATRDVTLIALGGGVIGDLVGFAAALWMRGVRFVQLPTSLLAMVDSSVGGKTAVNLAAGKNLVGAFWQPSAVVIDISLLQTLPAREYFSGLAEVLKYGAIADLDFFNWLEQNADALAMRDADTLMQAIAKSCAHKAAIVVRDEREQGERAHLNFGHTFGHALEAATRYQSLLHGEAVAIGMVRAAQLSASLGKLASSDVKRISDLLRRWNLPTSLSDLKDASSPALSATALLELMRLDKKNRAGELRLILLSRLGQAHLASASDAQILQAWGAD
jgi:3-dehydroquinate synthase